MITISDLLNPQPEIAAGRFPRLAYHLARQNPPFVSTSRVVHFHRQTSQYHFESLPAKQFHIMYILAQGDNGWDIYKHCRETLGRVLESNKFIWNYQSGDGEKVRADLSADDAWVTMRSIDHYYHDALANPSHAIRSRQERHMPSYWYEFDLEYPTIYFERFSKFLSRPAVVPSPKEALAFG